MTTKKITVKGLVQGIGYRPFVAETAESCRIGGWVRNTDGVVTILASGTAEDMERFLYKLRINSPVGTKVEELLCEEVGYQAFRAFQIVESEKLCEEQKKEVPLIPADLPTCDRCQKELHNPENRRYRHPFISCTACGPRYSIIESLPYDRDTITMKKFPMCDACSREYAERKNVRRHAQTIACPDCGPVLQFTEILYGKEVDSKEVGNKEADNREIADSAGVPEPETAETYLATANEEGCFGENAYNAAVSCLQSGGIVAVKDIGGYHLACTPFSEETVQQLRLLKGREKKPFAVMFPNVESIKEYCEVSVAEEALLVSAPRPIVLLKKRKSDRRLTENPGCKSMEERVCDKKLAENAGSKPLAGNVCGSSPDIGAMLPCNPLQTLLLEATGPLIMTSANASGELLILDNEKMADWMTKRANVCKEMSENTNELPMERTLQEKSQNEKRFSVPLAVLEHDRPILTPLDDSIVRTVCGRTQIIRRARGFVPNPVRVGIKKNIFAAGGDLKACFCHIGGGKAYLSQYLGDLEDAGCQQVYLREIKRMRKLFGFKPEYAAADMHPGYLSARVLAEDFTVYMESNEDVKRGKMWNYGKPEDFEAEDSKKQIYRIQHHEAHVASVIAEHNLTGTVLGFAFDGTGYGRDHTIWGSEVFSWNGDSMKRIAHLKPVRLIGGDEGAKNADSILYGYMASFGEETRKKWKKIGHRMFREDEQRSSLVEKAIQHNINTVTSTSMGRLFDAVSALLDICHYNGYEGEAAIELENLAATTEQAYRLSAIEVKKMEQDAADAEIETKVCEQDAADAEIEAKASEKITAGADCATELFYKNISGEKRISGESVLAEKLPEAYNCKMEFPENVRFCGDTESLFASILDALAQEIPKAQIARGFICAVSDFIIEICEQANEGMKSVADEKRGERRAIRQIVLSGGTFQNRILLEQTIKGLEEKEYQVYINEQVPCGDGGICLGQAFLCNLQLEKREL